MLIHSNHPAKYLFYLCSAMAETGNDIKKAASYLKQGLPVAIPTETVYGLAANALEEAAVRKIYTVKNRPLHNPLILHLAGKEELEKYVTDVPATAYKLIDRFWPGPLTLLLPKKDTVPSIITHGMPRVAVRVPDHLLTLELLKVLPFPLAAPSANPFGYISPTQAKHVQQQIGDKISYILDGGDCMQGIESTIVGFENTETIVYRLGAISVEEIESITGSISLYIKDETAPQAPGMLLKHYSPLTPFYLSDNIQESLINFKGKKVGLLLFNKPVANINITHQEVLSPKNDMRAAAARLYAAMHQMDAYGLDVIVAEKFPDSGIGKAINDRLSRAAVK